MIGRRKMVVTPRTLAARIDKLEEARPSDDVTQALVRELMELLRRRKRRELMRPVIAQMLKANVRATGCRDDYN